MAYFNRNAGDDAFVDAQWISGPFAGAAIAGVCDGVGGWKKYNLDAGALSRALCSDMQYEFQAEENSKSLPDPQKLLQDSFYKLEKSGDKFAGGTTACIGIFDPTGPKMKVVNIGDSGFMVLRGGRILVNSDRDSVGMVPKQLSIPPLFLVKDRQEVYEKYHVDLNLKTAKRPAWMQTVPEDAVLYYVELQHGDVIIFGSDGLFDNLYPNSILKAVSNKLIELEGWSDASGEFASADNVQGAAEIADMLVGKAYYHSLDPNYPSPFATRSFVEGHLFPGGKPDDITAVVSIVNHSD